MKNVHPNHLMNNFRQAIYSILFYALYSINVIKKKNIKIIIAESVFLSEK